MEIKSRVWMAGTGTYVITINELDREVLNINKGDILVLELKQKIKSISHHKTKSNSSLPMGGGCKVVEKKEDKNYGGKSKSKGKRQVRTRQATVRGR